jgi:hypothetical protein
MPTEMIEPPLWFHATRILEVASWRHAFEYGLSWNATVSGGGYAAAASPFEGWVSNGFEYNEV